jgi:predicted nucleic acid-binding protein
MSAMIGLDTGFLLRLLEGNPEAVRIWKALMEGDDSATSSLTLFELRRLAMTGKIRPDAADTVIEGLLGISRIVWLDSAELMERAASLSHSVGLPAVDALILTGLLAAGAVDIYTTDRHLAAFKKKGVWIHLLA